MPPLPTDNLWKFLTLGFVALIIVEFVQLRRTTDEADAAMIEIAAVFAELEFREKVMEEQVEQASSTDGDTDRAISPSDIELRMELLSARARLEGLIGATRRRLELATDRSEESKSLVKLWSAMLGASLLAWYMLFQRHQDKVLRLRVSEAQRQIKVMEESLSEAD